MSLDKDTTTERGIGWTALTECYLDAASRWEAGDLDEWSAITYPDQLHDYVTEEFRKIKKRQADLLGIKDGIRSKL